MRRLFPSLLVALGMLYWTMVHAAAYTASIPADLICSHSGSPFVGPCRTIHGDVALGGDNILVRIYPSGSNRILGYADEALQCALPQNLEALLIKERVVEADVVIRPVTESKPGFMQFVCIASVRNMRPKR